MCNGMVFSTVRGAVEDELEHERRFNKAKGDTNMMLDGVNELVAHVERNLMSNQSPVHDETKQIADTLAIMAKKVSDHLFKLEEENNGILAVLKETRADRDKISTLYYGLKYQLQQDVELKSAMFTYVGPGFPQTTDDEQYNNVYKQNFVGDCGSECAKYFFNDEDFAGYSYSPTDRVCYCTFDYTLPDMGDSGFNIGIDARMERYGEIKRVELPPKGKVFSCYKRNTLYLYEQPPVLPNRVPSIGPSLLPSSKPSVVPIVEPSSIPSVLPNRVPSINPSVVSSVLPSRVSIIDLSYRSISRKKCAEECSGITIKVNNDNIKEKISDNSQNKDVVKCFNTTHVTTMYQLFRESGYNGDLSCWDISSVTNISVSNYSNHKRILNKCLPMLDTYI